MQFEFWCRCLRILIIFVVQSWIWIENHVLSKYHSRECVCSITVGQNVRRTWSSFWHFPFLVSIFWEGIAHDPMSVRGSFLAQCAWNSMSNNSPKIFKNRRKLPKKISQTDWFPIEPIEFQAQVTVMATSETLLIKSYAFRKIWFWRFSPPFSGEASRLLHFL